MQVLSIYQKKPSTHFDLIKFVESHTNLEDCLDDQLTSLIHFRCLPDAFTWLVRQSDQHFNAWSRTTLLNFALEFAEGGYQPGFPAILEIILADRQIDSALCIFQGREAQHFFSALRFSSGSTVLKQSKHSSTTLALGGRPTNHVLL